MKYKYRSELPSDILIVEVEIASPNDGGSRFLAEAIVDTGATCSVVPAAAVSELGLKKYGYRNARGAFDKQRVSYPTYCVDITFGLQFCAKKVEVFARPRSRALIGRDVLNEIKIIANGPEREFELIKGTHWENFIKWFED